MARASGAQGARVVAVLAAVALLTLSEQVAVWAAAAQQERDMIGWLGETYAGGSGGASGASAGGRTNGPGMEVLSWEPRIFLYHNILTDEECDWLIKNSKPRLSRSGVSNAETGAGLVSNIRTSSGMFYSRGENPTVSRIEDRLARWTMLPVGNGEGIQVLRYQNDQRYDPHHDYFSFEARDDNGGNRMATVLMYLSDVEEGGETVFPKVPAPDAQRSAPKGTWSPCAMKGMAVRPRKGSAVVFWSIKPDGRFDVKSLHGSCPVIKGEKWSATKWIHVGHYAVAGEREEVVHRVQYVPPPPPAVPGCVNNHKLCDHWAEAGECEDNPTYMVGTKEAPGACLPACGRCDLGPNEKKGA